MNNEPVAWMSKIDNHIITFDKRLVNEAEHAGADNWMPMYLHPIKELTDEDLETIEEALLMVGFSDAFINYDLKEKALAILKKAQEK